MKSSEEVDAGAKTAGNNEETQEAEGLEVIEILPGFTKFDDFVNAGFNAIKAGIKAANNLPTGQKYNYYRCFSSFKDIINGEMKEVLDNMQNLIEMAGVSGSMRRRDIEEKFELLVEANDVFLERAGICMDEASGIVRNPTLELVVSSADRSSVSGSWNTTTSLPDFRPAETAERAQAIRLLAAKNIQRPQLTFKDKIDNSSKPWQPRINDKPNSLKPLALYVEETEDGEVFNHPYEFELDRFEPPETQLRLSDPVEYKSLEDTSLVVIEAPKDIRILLDDLRKYNEIAIDLEHHSYRSFQGITCLMQISTRDTDYLIDTLTLRSELHELNEIFTKPSVLKVFHGADSDILWLQRDLSLYIVNMFDTHQAAKQLNLPYLSLAFLLRHYCGVDPNKHFQLADWRIRPLPEELMKYAREDTHYLLYIKDKLRNALIESANGKSNVLKAVYDRSTELCKLTYRKPVWTEDSYMNIYRKSKKMFNNKQIYALKELHKWRDVIAREEDDSTGYVLPNHMLLNISESLPREMQGILACCNPIPPLVRQNLLTLHKIVLKAREQPLIKPVLEQDIRQRLNQRNQAADLETSWIYSPHDMPSGMEIRADLPCLLDSKSSDKISQSKNEVAHCITVFDSLPVFEDEETTGKKTSGKRRRTPFVSPFERYKRVLPMVAAEEAIERERQEKEEAERIKKVETSQKETAESISRVHEHFKKASMKVDNSFNNVQSDQPTHAQVVEPKVPEIKQKSLSQMRGRKRKRQSNFKDDDNNPSQSEVDFATPKPSLKSNNQKRREAAAEMRELKKNRIALNIVRGSKLPRIETIQTLRGPKKGEKKKNQQEMMNKGMLPAETFNYQEVDFSTFQGGSRTDNTPKPVMLEDQNKNKNAKGARGKGNKNKKKQKWKA